MHKPTFDRTRTAGLIHNANSNVERTLTRTTTLAVTQNAAYNVHAQDNSAHGVLARLIDAMQVRVGGGTWYVL